MEKTLNESIIKIRVELQNTKLKKSGKNKYAGFEYYELKDFLPKLNELLLEEKVNDKFSIENGEATLTLMKGEEKQEYKMPFVMFDTPLNNNGKPSMQDIQYLGALNTYYKRYVYLNAFGITDGEVIDSMNNSEIKQTTKRVTKKEVEQKGNDIMIQESQIEMIKKLYTSDELTPMLKHIGKTNINELTLVEASSLIKRKEVK